MPIVINTTEQFSRNRIAPTSIAQWLQQSLARFMNNHKGKLCTNLQCEDTHGLGKSLSNTLIAREENTSVAISSSVPISRLKYENMLRNLECIRKKWDMVLNTSLIEDAGLITIATQCNLIGLSSMPGRDKHLHNRSVCSAHIVDESYIHTSQETEVVLQEISRSEYEVQAGSLLKPSLTQFMNEPNPSKLHNQPPPPPCDYRDAFRRKNYKLPDMLHSCQPKNDYVGYPIFHRILYTYCASLGARLCILNIGCLKYLESVVHSWEQFMQFLGRTSLRGGDVIYLLSRTTMRRVKFLYEKPPTTITV